MVLLFGTGVNGNLVWIFVVVFFGSATGDENSCFVFAMRVGESKVVSAETVDACAATCACSANFDCVVVLTRYTRLGGAEYDAVTGVAGLSTFAGLGII